MKLVMPNADAKILHVAPNLAMNSKKDIIMSDRSTIDHSIRIISIDSQLNPTIVFSVKVPYATTFLSPTVDKNDMIYAATLGAKTPTKTSESTIYCFFPDGTIKWQYYNHCQVSSKVVINACGHALVYVLREFTSTNYACSLLSINENGCLNWQHDFESVNWCEPILSQDGTIYCGTNNGMLYALSENGKSILEKEVGRCSYQPFVIKKDNTIYLTPSINSQSPIVALTSEFEEKWTYKPDFGNVCTPPCIDENDNIYFYLAPFKLTSLNCNGEVRWSVPINGSVMNIPILCNEKILINSIKPKYPVSESWLEIYDFNGIRLKEVAFQGDVIASLVDDDKVYTLVNGLVSHNGKKWLNKEDIHWELHITNI